MQNRLTLLTKPAVPGRVKTRLIGALDAVQAAALHRAFVADVAARLRRAESFAFEVSWDLGEEAEPPDWPETRGLLWRRQSAGDLGDRLFEVLTSPGSSSGAGGPQRVAAVGSDHPELAPRAVEQAFDALARGADMAIGPAEDGGYYLIALRREAVKRRLFEDVEWSTGRVFSQTLDRAAELGFRVEELPSGHDVDLHADLEALAARLERREADFCPATRRALAELGLGPRGRA